MKKNFNKLDDKQLDAVTGGDYGDTDLEYADTPEGVKYLYNVGDHVEVYHDSLIHVHTDGATIIERKAEKINDTCSHTYYGIYNVRYDESGNENWVTADRIER